MFSHRFKLRTPESGQRILGVMINEEAFAILLAEVEATKRAHHDARKRFWEMAGRSRESSGSHEGGPPPVEGFEPMRAAVSEEGQMRKAHIEAVMRLNRYLLDGTIPDNVRGKLSKTNPACNG